MKYKPLCYGKSVIFMLVLAALFAAFSVSAQNSDRPIKIKIAQYPNEFEFNCPQGAAWELGGVPGRIAPGEKCVVKGEMTASAVRRYRVMVTSTSLAEKEQAEAVVEEFRALGYSASIYVAGTEIFAEDNKTLICDNRKAMVEVGVFNDKASAQALVDRLAAQGKSSWIQEEIVSLSKGSLSLSINGQFKATGEELAILPQQTIHLKKVEYGAGYAWHGYADRNYTGSMLVKWGAHNALDCILSAGMEYVLAGVVPSEISANAEIGALQAQAVAARGDIIAKIGVKHGSEGFDVCSEQHCQVFSGESVHSVNVGRKIAPTRGYVLLNSNNAILDAVYAANCGGHSEANHFVWTTQPNPILRGVWDHSNPPALDLTEEEQVGVFIRNPPSCHCNNPSVEGGHRFRWNKTITGTEWRKIQDSIGVGRLRSVTDIARGISGRIYRITFVGERGNKTVMKELNIRRLFGGLFSSCFIADWKKDSAGFVTGVELLGAGFGHGVGMCQTGAQSLAKQGWTFQRILSHYYPGSVLRKIY